MPRREDVAPPRPGASSIRTLTLAGGFVLAVAATLAVFLTDNPQYLRVAVVAVAWAFVLAAFAAGSRGTDRAAAAAREAELRRAYELELEREIATRHEYELELENELRRETEASMRYELDALREDIAALSPLREDVGALAALREDLVGLTSLRPELEQLTELRADMGRLRAELTEQLSSELFIERIVMRTQAGRLSSDSVRTERPEGSVWSGDVPPRELTGGWPAIRLDEPRDTQHFEQVRVERAGPRPPVPGPGAVRWSAGYRHGDHQQFDGDVPSWPSSGVPGTQTFDAVRSQASRPTPHKRPRPAVETPPDSPPTTLSPIARPSVTPPEVEPLPTPMEWLAARSLLAPAPATPPLPDLALRRRRGDDGDALDPAVAPTAVRPAVPPAAKPAWDHAPSEREEAPPTQERRLADILAENGVSPATGGRRRRRYRDEDESDDVLSRVLREN